MPAELVSELWRRFEHALLPLDTDGKLGVVLFQFPPWFYAGEEQRNYILSCKERLPQYRIAVEFRHNSWVNDGNRERTFGFLRDNKPPFVCVDEPQDYMSSIPPITEATADLALVRFHGRNQEMWERKGIRVTERFNYLYSREELEEWVPQIRELASKTRQLHVLYNNCYQDKAVLNARQISLMLD
jgi:uncharacterized protein YecE (DUF72 family)